MTVDIQKLQTCAAFCITRKEFSVLLPPQSFLAESSTGYGRRKAS